MLVERDGIIFGEFRSESKQLRGLRSRNRSGIPDDKVASAGSRGTSDGRQRRDIERDKRSKFVVTVRAGNVSGLSSVSCNFIGVGVVLRYDADEVGSLGVDEGTGGGTFSDLEWSC